MGTAPGGIVQPYLPPKGKRIFCRGVTGLQGTTFRLHVGKLMVRLDDLRGLFQPSWFYDFILKVLPAKGTFKPVPRSVRHGAAPCTTSERWPVAGCDHTNAAKGSGGEKSHHTSGRMRAPGPDACERSAAAMRTGYCHGPAAELPASLA